MVWKGKGVDGFLAVFEGVVGWTGGGGDGRIGVWISW